MFLGFLFQIWLQAQAAACDFHIMPLSQQIKTFPMDMRQVTSLSAYWEGLISDIQRVDFSQPNPILNLTQVLRDDMHNGREVVRLEIPRVYRLTKFLVQGWKNLGLIKHHKFALMAPEQIIERFNQRGPMKAIWDKSRATDGDLRYVYQIMNNIVYIADIHDILFHLPLFSESVSRTYIKNFAKDLYLHESTRGSAMNLIFEDGSNFNSGIFIGQLTGLENPFTSASPTSEEFYKKAMQDLNLIRSANSSDLVFVLATIKPSESAMWFSGLVSVYIKQLSLFTRSHYYSNKNRAGLKDSELTMQLLKETYDLIQDFPMPLEDELKALQIEIEKIHREIVKT